jgi:hypothetical protein
MPVLSCLPCFKDKDTRHSIKNELDKPIPVEKIVNDSNGSAAKPSTNVPTPSNAVTFSNDKQQGSNDQSATTQAVTYASDNQNESTDQSTSTQVITYANEKPNPVHPADTNNAVTFNNERQPEPNAGPAPESDISALKSRKPTSASEESTEPNSSYATPLATMADSLKSAASGVTGTVSSGAQQAQSAASTGAEKVTGAASGSTSGTKDWEAMTEDQKKATYDALPEGSDQKKMGYYEWVKQGFFHQKENWMPWIEDQYLRWFTKDNKASYATKGTFGNGRSTCHFSY